jgi:gamma-glutamylcyclotransferase (GGCT)/AIG2-like uncharacterized protein YtfP
MPEILAVYGTLRDGGGANGLMRGCKYLGKDKVKGKIYSFGQWPGLIKGDEGEVVVDLYEIPPELPLLLSNIDRYEGYFPEQPDQSLFEREKVLTLNCKEVVWVYKYRFDCNTMPLISNGDWLSYDKR